MSDFDVEPLLTVKTLSSSDGKVYSLDSNGWLSVNGEPVWNSTRDFALGADGTLYWHCTNGVLQHRQANGAWDTLGYDVTKFVVTGSGTVYSLDSSNWLSVNGVQVWSLTADFGLTADETLFWQCTDGVLQKRFAGGVWASIASGVNRFTLRDDGVLYLADNTGWLKINGEKVWDRTHDFILMDDHSIFWHCDNGMLQKNPAGIWQTVSLDVTKFAVRNDAVVFTLSSGGDVFQDGVLKWSNIGDMRFDSLGHLVVETTGGTTHALSGQFRLSRELVVGGGAGGAQAVGAGGEAAGNLMTEIMAQAFSLSDGGLPTNPGLTNGVAPISAPQVLVAPGGGTLSNDRPDALPSFTPETDHTVYPLEDLGLNNSQADESPSELPSAVDDDADEPLATSVNIALDALFEELGA